MFSAVSGLRSHQTMMDVIGNNIANVNTTAFKSGSVIFQDLLSQTIKSAGGPQNGLGGSNPAQVGLGVKVGSITNSFAQGALQQTGRQSDLAIQGDGFFIADQAGARLYTRSGDISFDTTGRLVTKDGGSLMGWMADPTGKIDQNKPITGLVMPPGETIAPSQSHSVRMGGNLPSDAAPGIIITTSISVFDTQGAQTPVLFDFTKSATPNQWTIQARDALSNAIGAPATLTFDPTTGQLNPTTYTVTPPGVWDAQALSVDFGKPGDPTATVQYGGTNTLQALSQDGNPLGSLQSYNTSPSGIVTGVFSNGQTRTLAQLALANFNNPIGLEKTGGSMFRETANSGIALIGAAGTSGRGQLTTGSLEMSNVDLGQEFTNMIVAQRGFQANSRVITASDELLQDLVNLKR
jgi:flagellar hook protein FlgE